MFNNLIKVFSILLALGTVVSFFAILAPSNQVDTAPLGAINTPMTSVVLENLIMNHSEITDDYESIYGVCDGD